MFCIFLQTTRYNLFDIKIVHAVHNNIKLIKYKNTEMPKMHSSTKYKVQKTKCAVRAM